MATQTLEEAQATIAGLEAHIEALGAVDRTEAAAYIVRLEDENKRMRAAFKDLIQQVTDKEPLTLNISGCEWCGEHWPATKGRPFDETYEAAKLHLRTCTKHPLKAENARLRKALVVLGEAMLARHSEKAVRAIVAAAKRDSEFTVEVSQ